MNNFWQRLITGFFFVSALIGAIVLGGWYMAITFGAIVFFGLLEFYKLFEKTETQPQRLAGTILGTSLYLVILLTGYLGENYHLSIITVGLAITCFIIISIIELFRAQAKPFNNIAVTMAGIIYLVLPFLLLNAMSFEATCNGIIYSSSLVLSIFVMIWSNDTFAYLAGRMMGKHKLFERISPKKTWEGFIGGVVFAVIAGILFAYFLEQSYAKFITYALVVSVIGTLGDLVESMLKRSVDVKDSGTILPGHGGILDRFDAVLFVVPVIFFLEEYIFVPSLI